MPFHLLGQQMVFGNLEFFFAGVAGQLNDLHTVAERAGNGAQCVGSYDKEYIRKVERHLDIVVSERMVLLRIKHFEQCRGRIPPVVVAQFVHLIEQHQRVGTARQLHRSHDPSGHRADIGFAVAAYVAFVPHAAQRNPHVFTPHRLCDRAGNRSLSNSRRPHQADDLPFDVGRELAHRKQLQNPLLDLLQAVVLLVEQRLCLFDVDFIGGALVPGEVKHCIQIPPDHPCFVRVARQTRETVGLLGQLLGRLLIQLELPDP